MRLLAPLGRLHAGHWLGLAAFLYLPLAVLAPKGETALLLFVALPLLARLAIRRRLVPHFRRPLGIVLGLLLGWALTSVLWSIVPDETLSLLKSLIVIFLAALTTVAAAGELETHERRTVAGLALAGLGLGLVLLVIELAAGLPLANLLRGPRPGLPQLELSMLNAGLVALLIVMWPLALELGRRRAGAGALLLLLAAVLVLWGVSASAKLALGLAALVGLAVFFGGRRALRIFAVLVVAGIALAPVVPRTVLTPERFAASFPELRDSALHRVHIWDFSARTIAQRPLVGWGLDSSRAIPGGQVEAIEHGPYMSLHPHNAALQMWLELGLPGAAAFAALALIGLIAAGRLETWQRAAAAAALAAALGVASLSFGIWQNWWLATLALAAAITTALWGEGEKPSQAKPPLI